MIIHLNTAICHKNRINGSTTLFLPYMAYWSGMKIIKTP